MMARNDEGQLILPALRARMGQWWYYISAMRMSDVAKRVSIVDEIHTSESLRDLLQRTLQGERTTKIKDYLITQDQRFFNSLVVGTYGGDPKWHEVSIKSTPSTGAVELPGHLEGVLGLLVLDGTEKLFAIDGQHRVAGIREALKAKDSLETEEISVILVAGITQEHRQDDPGGFQRTRRLFTTLNRYAKPISKRDKIALDEDDAVAIVTRLLIEEYALFAEKTSTTHGNNIIPSDQSNFTTIGTLYDCLDKYLQEGTSASWNKFKRFRPNEDKLERLRQKAILFWDIYCRNFPELMELANSLPSENIASRFRQGGGHLLFRPLGLLVSVRVVRDLMDSKGISPEAAILNIAQVPMELKDELWTGLIWDSTNRRMLATSDRKSAAWKLMFYAADGDLSHLKTSRSSLRRELAGLLNKEESAIGLRRFVSNE